MNHISFVKLELLQEERREEMMIGREGWYEKDIEGGRAKVCA